MAMNSIRDCPVTDIDALPQTGYAAAPDTVNTVPEPSTLLLSLAAIEILARVVRKATRDKNDKSY